MAALRKMLGDMNGNAATALMRLIETQSKETLTRWAAAYAKEHYLLLIKEEPEIFHQMEQTISAVENFLNNEMMLKELKLHLAGARSADCGRRRQCICPDRQPNRPRHPRPSRR